MTGRPSIATRLARPWSDGAGPITPPIHQTSLLAFDDYAAFEARMMGQSAEPLYSRVQNPTVAAFEQMMADLEGGEAAVAFASGMGAISATVFGAKADRSPRFQVGNASIPTNAHDRAAATSHSAAR